jgi:hypothetical protein
VRVAASARNATRTRRERRPPKRRWTLTGRNAAQLACEDVLVALSCEIDGESHPLAAKDLDRHVRSCISCGQFASRAPTLRLSDQVVLSKRPPAQLLEELNALASVTTGQRRLRAACATRGVKRKPLGAPAPHPARPQWVPNRKTVGAFAMAGVPALAAVCAAALGPWSPQHAIAAHLTSNGCIVPLLARHLWPGY